MGGTIPSMSGVSLEESGWQMQALVKSSAKSAILVALNEASMDVAAGRTPAIDTDYLMEVVHEDAGRRSLEVFHGDSEHQPWIQAERARLAKPSTITTLQNGHRYDTRAIGPSREKHRERNNRLQVEPDADDGGGKPPARPRNNAPQPRLYPDQFPDQFPAQAYNIGPRSLVTPTSTASSAAFANPRTSTGASYASWSAYASSNKAISGAAAWQQAINPPFNGETVDLTYTPPSKAEMMMERLLKRSLEDAGAHQILGSSESQEVVVDECIKWRVNRIVNRPEDALCLVNAALDLVPEATLPAVARLFDTLLSE